MKKEDIKIGDWMRMLMGEVPPSFLIEVVIRTIILYVLLIVSMRLFGRRMATKLSRVELMGLFSLAAAIGVPLQAPDRGLLPAVVIAVVVVGVGRLVSVVTSRNERAEHLVEGEYVTLVRDGVIQMDKMKASRLTLERLLAQLRGEGTFHFGEVRRLYFEANGSFSLVRAPEPIPGLTVLPASDPDFIDEQDQAKQTVCGTCGLTGSGDRQGVCTNCKDTRWVPVISTRKLAV
ncbi:MAG: hypothetical protein JWP27_2416 [Flaviaesturariibacter sp.]|nr:hypothetical protein [Flaviaesturariibacter sp.]